MVEVRLRIDYGDYLALNLSEVKSSQFRWLRLEGEEDGWVAIGRGTAGARRRRWGDGPRLKDQSTDQLPRPPTPLLNDIKRAADVLKTESEQLLFGIHAYAGRNSLCGSRLKSFVDGYKWENLAKW